MKKCPYCAEEVQDEAIKCKHCGQFLSHATSNEVTATSTDSTPKGRSELGDFFSFRLMASPVLIKIIYSIGAAVLTVAGIEICIEKGPMGVLFIVLGNLLWRIICEGMILLFSVHEILSSIENELKHLQGEVFHGANPTLKVKKGLGLGIIFLVTFALGIIGIIINQYSNKRSESATNSAKATENKTYKEGDTVSVGYTSYTVLESYWSNNLSNTQSISKKPDAMYLFVKLTIRNDSTLPSTISSFKLIDEKGAEIIEKTLFSHDGSILEFVSLNPKVQESVYIVFDIPINHKYKLKASEDTFIELSPKSNIR